MSKKNGFTLVELMVVIVIIGVLAAVAIPKMMAATNKAKASEGPQILGTIANMQHAFKAEQDTFRTCLASSVAAQATSGWADIGMDQNPGSNYFVFAVAPSNSADPVNFNATATLRVGLGKATANQLLGINAFDVRTVDAVAPVNTNELAKLVPNWK